MAKRCPRCKSTDTDSIYHYDTHEEFNFCNVCGNRWWTELEPPRKKQMKAKGTMLDRAVKMVRK